MLEIRSSLDVALHQAELELPEGLLITGPLAGEWTAKLLETTARCLRPPFGGISFANELVAGPVQVEQRICPYHVLTVMNESQSKCEWR
jgi:hypothetical protein